MRFDMGKNNNQNNDDDDDEIFDDEDDSFDGMPNGIQDDRLRFMEMGYLQEKLDVDFFIALLAQAKEITAGSFFWRFKSSKKRNQEIWETYHHLRKIYETNDD